VQRQPWSFTCNAALVLQAKKNWQEKMRNAPVVLVKGNDSERQPWADKKELKKIPPKRDFYF
jgi:hypothetical protein